MFILLGFFHLLSGTFVFGLMFALVVFRAGWTHWCHCKDPVTLTVLKIIPTHENY